MMAFFENPNDQLAEYIEIIDNAQRKAFLSIGIEIQKEEIENLQEYRNILSERKRQYIARSFEAEANLLFCLGSAVEVVQNELKMLINFKEDQMADAWMCLIRAQTLTGVVVRNLPFGAEGWSGYIERLHNYEKLLFPEMIFHSIGGIVKKSECSICKQEYGACDHIKGRLYMGEMCVREIHEMAVEEGSVVTNPANKLCRTLSIKQNGVEIDLLTLREILPEEKNKNEVEKLEPQT